MKALGIAFSLSLAALVAGCGGGGGSPGNTELEYKITLRADTKALPVNIANAGPQIGTSAPYTTVLHVGATEGGKPIVGTKEAFACNLEAGLRTGALYYLDGDSEHETEVQVGGQTVKIPNAYRSVVLDSNSGGNSFHFHAGDTRGTARITCSITNPRDNQVTSASVDIVVGDAIAPAAGMPASVNFQAQAPRYLGSRNNPNSVLNSISVQAMVRDEVGQWVGDTTSPNLQVYIHGGSASAGARLMHDRQTGTVIMTNTRNGVANFSLSSGVERGVITLVMVADRADNNVANGIQDPISQRLTIPVVNGIALKPLAIAPDQSVTATCNQAVSMALVATDGVPPYTWSVAGTMPAGLALSSDGLVTGVPTLQNGAGAGTYQVVVNVTDYNGTTASTNLSVTVEAGDCKPLAIGDSSIAVTKGTHFAFAFSATGGKPPYTWKALAGMPSGLTLSDAGILSGSVSTVGSYKMVVEVTDKDGIKVVANVTIEVTEPETP
ncbi:Ig family protein [Ottowia sp. GY511]|uniref:Ig domain-containing protein n=1 Tax=Ottowia flava TaxID=2675430 RepID=A0ABW4KXQ2_9BURK|nr:Ig domain-containing protein [Ottowia sp. GY511]TXK31384.1 Ig family protein [Ottowia sp. GY511]